jgi:hypothetical protein
MNLLIRSNCYIHCWEDGNLFIIRYTIYLAIYKIFSLLLEFKFIRLLWFLLVVGSAMKIF